MVKFILAMAGVVISSIIIFLGLHIYNKIINKHNPVHPEEIMQTPKTKDEAINFFIRKNKLK